MKKLTQIVLALLCLCMPALLAAAERDDSKYLAGAVPEVDGKVVFTKDFSIPGMTQQDIYNRVLGWMEARLKANQNTSRILFTNQEKGQIVGMGDEWIVFSSSALSLDRTRIIYQLTALCQPEKCTLRVEKIRFIYREGKEKYSAEEWIVDKYALNKDKTKLIRGLAKWRRKTVDFVDNFAKGVIEALSAVEQTPAPVAEKVVEKKPVPADNNTPIVIIQKKQVQEVAPVAATVVAVEVPPVVIPKKSAQPVQPEQPVEVTLPKKPAPAGTVALSADLIQTSAGKLVIVIGEEPFNMTMMTANAGGSLGKVDGKQVIFTILSPDQPYEMLEKAQTYSVRFYPNGSNEPSVILQCKKMPAPTAIDGMPRTYVGEIINATVK